MKKLLLSISLFLSVTVVAQLPSYVPASGLVGYWPFTGNANDQSINSNNGSVSVAILTTDRFSIPNAAYNFNGTSDYISVPNSSSLSGFNDMSISVWIKLNQFSGIQTFISKWFYTLNCGSNTDTYALALVSNSIVSATNNNNVSAFYAPQSLTSGDLNLWKHIVFVSNSALSYQAIYVNGVLSGTTSVPGTICNSTNALIFGAAIPTFRWFNGGLDDIGIWNRVLTPCEISRLYTSSSASPLTSASTSNTLICAGNSATLTANGSATSYLWNTSATTPVIVVSPAVTTTYTVTATNTVTGCTNTITVTQNVSLCTGIQTNNLNNEISLYPNPTNGLVIINGVKEKEDIEVMNVLGALLYKIKATDNKTEIDLSGQTSGVYFIRLKVNNGTIIKKVIKE